VSEQGSLAARIRRGESFTRPVPVSRADELIALGRHATGQFDAWYAAIEQADTHTLIAVITAIGRGDEPLGSRGPGYREAARSMLEQKLTDRMIAKMEDLERASGRLGKIAIIVGALIGIGAPVLQWWLQ
jgi:hypothetical protein